jgi:CheY-like chemotaxis protein
MFDQPPEFKELVKDALSHLYDVGHLQTHPLVEQLYIPEDRLVAGGRARALRQVLFDAIEALKPNETSGLTSRTGRAYKLLYRRYIEGIKATEVALHLSLSDRQYFRELEKAVDELCQLLWDGSGAARSSGESTHEDDTTVESEALRLSQQEKERWFNLWEVIQGLADDLRAVLDSRQTYLVLHSPANQAAAAGIDNTSGTDRIPIYTNRILLRQLLLYTCLEISTRVSKGALEIRCEELPDAVTITISLSHPPPGGISQICEQLKASTEIIGLLGVINARLDCQPQGHDAVQISIPTSRWNILIVDDNSATLRLFRRFLATENCRIFDAASVSKAIQFLRQTSMAIHLIIMDVMMPNQDGWEGLQKIRAHPSSQHIPVVICSVLNQPDLARSLGAAGFLAKPVSQEGLIEVVHRFLFEENAS